MRDPLAHVRHTDAGTFEFHDLAERLQAWGGDRAHLAGLRHDLCARPQVRA